MKAKLRSKSDARSISPTATLQHKNKMCHSLRQYEELIQHLWSQLDPEGKQEITEARFTRFLREQKILTEKLRG